MHIHDYTGHYLTKAASDPGAGDILMGFLGSVILSFSFSMFKQRKVINIRNPVWWKYGIKFRLDAVNSDIIPFNQSFQLVKRHAAEIFSSVIISSLFSLYSTALAGRLLGLEQSLAISVLPRCITVALALSIVSFFEGQLNKRVVVCAEIGCHIM